MVERYRDSFRLFRLLSLLQGTGRTLSQLQKELSVSPPTLRRDLHALRGAGFVISEVRSEGRKVVRCNATTVPMSPTTAAWLLLTTLFDEVHGGMAEEELSTLRRVAAERLSIEPETLAGRLFRQPSPREIETLGPSLEVVLDATLSDRVLRIRYRAWGSATEREVRIEPWSIARLGDRLYVLGPELDHPGPGWAAWRIDRITSAERLRLPFTRPADWEPARAYVGRFGAFHDDEPPVWVTLRLEARRGHAILRARLPWCDHRSREEEDHIILDVLVHADKAFLQWILHLGEDAVVLEPPEVRRAVGEIYWRLARVYDPPPSG
jgi:predicted DNA-binding transcriptional regulator YafY